MEEKKKTAVKKRHGVPVKPEDCLSEASDIMCRATYRFIKLAYGGDGEPEASSAGAKSLKEYWSVLKEALSVTGAVKEEAGEKDVIRVVMDEYAERYSV